MAMGIAINHQKGCWVQYQLKLRNLTLEDVARKANVTSGMVTHFLKGRKNSEKVRRALADVLGFDSFEKLIAASCGREAV
jgi:transcriptional regulator with XRE-family HTH domain